MQWGGCQAYVIKAIEAEWPDEREQNWPHFSSPNTRQSTDLSQTNHAKKEQRSLMQGICTTLSESTNQSINADMEKQSEQGMK